MFVALNNSASVDECDKFNGKYICIGENPTSTRQFLYW